MTDLVNALNIDVACYGNHDFDLNNSGWPSNCQHLPKSDILDPTTIAEKIARHLRRYENCDLVIAITHMRLAEDIEVSQNTLAGDERVDFIFCGHDNFTVQRAPHETNAAPKVAQMHSDGNMIRVKISS